MGSKLVQDGIVFQSESQAKALWRLREDTPLSLSAAGAVYMNDLSMPTKSMFAIVDDTKTAQVAGYGHIGDGDLHLNILVPRSHLPPHMVFRYPTLPLDTMRNTGASSNLEFMNGFVT